LDYLGLSVGASVTALAFGSRQLAIRMGQCDRNESKLMRDIVANNNCDDVDLKIRRNEALFKKAALLISERINVLSRATNGNVTHIGV